MARRSSGSIRPHPLTLAIAFELMLMQHGPEE